MKKKRILAIADTHCGSLAGLTPPAWQFKENKGSNTKHNKWAKIQKELWNNYLSILEKWQPFDIGLSLGDMVEGKGKRSGGTELISSDMEEQSDMAVAVHNTARQHASKDFKWIGVYGTAYHTAPDGEDWENIVASRAGFEKIGSHEWIDVNGVIIDMKHHIGGSTIPHGRHTAVAKDMLWNMLWADKGYAPKANILLRAHVHYHQYCGGSDWVAMTLPALQGMGGKYGSRRCSGLVDWGAVIIDVYEDGSVDWHSDTKIIDAQKASALVV